MTLRRIMLPLLLAVAVLGLSPAYASLSDEDEAQRLLMALEASVAENRWSEARGYLRRLEDKEGLGMPEEFHFLRGRVLEQRGMGNEARRAYEQYVSESGREGDMYRNALQRITVLEEEGRDGRRDHEAVASLEPAGGSELEQLQQLYLTDDPIEALLEHVNSLLSVNAWEGRSRVVVRERQRGIHYRFRLEEDRLQVRTRDDSELGRSRVTTQRLNIFGVDPRVVSECFPEEQACWISDPRDGSRWLKLAQKPEQARETARMISLMLREMQNRR